MYQARAVVEARALFQRKKRCNPHRALVLNSFEARIARLCARCFPDQSALVEACAVPMVRVIAIRGLWDSTALKSVVEVLRCHVLGMVNALPMHLALVMQVTLVKAA